MTWLSSPTMWSSRRCLPAPLAGSSSSSSRPATRGCSSGCRSVCCFLASWPFSHFVTQEPKADKDEELCKKVCIALQKSKISSTFWEICREKTTSTYVFMNMLQVNENLNNPPAPGSARAGGGSGAGLPGGLPAGFPFHFYNSPPFDAIWR